MADVRISNDINPKVKNVSDTVFIYDDNTDYVGVTSQPTETNGKNVVGKMLTKFKSKQRLLSVDNFFVVDLLTPAEEDGTVGKYSMYTDAFSCQLFKLESDSYQVGFQQVSFLKDVMINDKFELTFLENPHNNITTLIYDHLFNIIKNNRSRILNDNRDLFKEVYVYHFLDTVLKQKGNHIVYKFENVKLFDIDDNDINVDYKGANLIGKKLQLKYNKVTVFFHDTENGTVKEYQIDVINGIFNQKETSYETAEAFNEGTLQVNTLITLEKQKKRLLDDLNKQQSAIDSKQAEADAIGQ